MVIKCASPGCDNTATGNLACPNCKKLGIDNYFCTQECFKKNYAAHKQVHAIAKKVMAAKRYVLHPLQRDWFVAVYRYQLVLILDLYSLRVRFFCSVQQQQQAATRDGITCPLDAPNELKESLPDWATIFSFSGSLRPMLLSPKRVMPPNIRRPDYADHFAGASESEQRDKRNHNNIRVYTEKELDAEYGLRHACKMGREVLDTAGKALRVGVTTDEIDRVVHEACIERDCYPSPLNYYK